MRFLGDSSSRCGIPYNTLFYGLLVCWLTLLLQENIYYVDAFILTNSRSHSSLIIIKLFQTSNNVILPLKNGRRRLHHNNNNGYYCWQEIQRKSNHLLASSHRSDDVDVDVDVDVVEPKEKNKLTKKRKIVCALAFACCLRSLMMGSKNQLLWGSSALSLLAVIYGTRTRIRRSKIIKNNNNTNTTDMHHPKDAEMDENETTRKVSAQKKRSEAWVSASLQRVDEANRIMKQQRLAEAIAKEEKRVASSKKWAEDALRSSGQALKLAEEQRQMERDKKVQDELWAEYIIKDLIT